MDECVRSSSLDPDNVKKDEQNYVIQPKDQEDEQRNDDFNFPFDLRLHSVTQRAPRCVSLDCWADGSKWKAFDIATSFQNDSNHE